MYDNPKLVDKMRFLKHFIKNYQMKRRESLWILNYLLNHEVILNQIRFIEKAELTPRGMVMSAEGSNENPDFKYYKNGYTYEDPEQAFHDIRLRWQDVMYLELHFPDDYKVLRQYGVLEENPFDAYDVSKDPELISTVDDYLLNMQYQTQRKYLIEEIDKALAEGDRNSFELLSEQLTNLELTSKGQN